MVEEAITGSIGRYNLLIASRMPDIQKEWAAGRQVRLHVVVETQSVATDFGPAQIKAEVASYSLLFEGDIPLEWPLFQPKRGFFATLFNTPQITRGRESFDFVL